MIKTIKGNAVHPEGDGMKIIVHCANNIGAWGAGFVMALSAEWPEPEAQYRSLTKEQLKLGNVQFVKVEDDILVANLIGQDNIKYINNEPPIRYEAIREGLETVKKMCISTNATIHCPQFGSGLSGGSWETIEQIITDVMGEDIDVTVYEYDDKSSPNYVKNNK
jgi:O-acetyl-ADP-ribose deacetylase (regulator of RNase III)